MNTMDRIYLEHPTAGVRTMTAMLELEHHLHVNKKRVSRLMHVIGLEPIYPQKSLSKSTGRVLYKAPYLLRGLPITRVNQVWSTDISYIPMKHGFMYMYAIIDVYSRRILGSSLENTLAAENATRLLEECVKEYGAPEIINTDQGSQYTGQAWKDSLEKHGIRMSMDGRGRCKDNIWIERFWRTIKQEYIYLHPFDEVCDLRKGIEEYIEYYNHRRPHQGLGGKTTPDQKFREAA